MGAQEAGRPHQVKRRAVLALLGLGLSFALGCRSKSAETQPVVQVESPVPRPPGVLADFRISDPHRTWQTLQRGVGGIVAVLPSTWGALMLSLVGFDPTWGDWIDGTETAFGVVLGSLEAPDVVVAAKIRDRTNLEQRIRKSALPKDVREIDGLVVVARGQAALGLGGGYVLASTSAKALVDAGPYVYRTLPKTEQRRDAPILLDVTDLTSVAGWGRTRWQAFLAEKRAQEEAMRKAHGGREPDFADPKPLLAYLDTYVGERIAWLDEAERMLLSVSPTAEGLHATTRITPRPGSPTARAVASWSVGDARPLLDESQAARFSFLFRESAENRREKASRVAVALRDALGKRLSSAESQRVQNTWNGWEAGRGDWLTVSWLRDEAQSRVKIRSPVNDADALRGAMDGWSRLFTAQAFVLPARSALGLNPARRNVEEDTPQTHREIWPAWEGKGSVSHDARVGWRVEREVTVEFGLPLNGPSWREHAAIVELLESARDDVLYAALVRPSARRDPPTFVWVGRREGAAWLETRVTYAALQELVRTLR